MAQRRSERAAGELADAPERDASKGGRPYSFTQEKADAIVAKVREGLFLSHAAGLARVPASTAQEWLDRGRGSVEEPFHSFYMAMMEAEAHAAAEVFEMVRTSKTGKDCVSHTYATWILQTRFRHEYGAKAEVEHSGIPATVVITGLDALSAESMSELAEKMEAKAKAAKK